MKKLKGTGVALVTPFTQEKEIDFKNLKTLLEHTANGGCDYWVVMGTTGESVTMTEEEKASVLRFIIENNPNNLPIAYGIGGNNTADCIHKLTNDDLQGVDAILSASPAYNKPSQNGIYEHFTALAAASPLPILLYNVPGRTASNMSAETTLKLALDKNIVGIKEASGNLEQCMEISRNKPNDFLLISGDDLLTVPMMSIGAAGVISVLANAIPSTFKQMIDSTLANDYRSASKKAFSYQSLNALMYEESNPVGIKALLHLLHVCQPHVRLPLVAASEFLREKIAAELELFPKNSMP